MSIKNAIKNLPIDYIKISCLFISFNVEKSSFFVFNDIVILEEYRQCFCGVFHNLDSSGYLLNKRFTLNM